MCEICNSETENINHLLVPMVWLGAPLLLTRGVAFLTMQPLYFYLTAQLSLVWLRLLNKIIWFSNLYLKLCIHDFTQCTEQDYVFYIDGAEKIKFYAEMQYIIQLEH